MKENTKRLRITGDVDRQIKDIRKTFTGWLIEAIGKKEAKKAIKNGIFTNNEILHCALEMAQDAMKIKKMKKMVIKQTREDFKAGKEE